MTQPWTRRGFLAAGTAAAALSGCASSKFRRYDGPEVTQIIVAKPDRRLFLMHEDKVLKDYRVALGFAPVGHKTMRGDGRTPEGRYVIDRRNPNSSFHLSVGISYPDAEDIARAAEIGVEPGGDIFIHGRPNNVSRRMKGDWTAGCIAVENREIEEIYAMVREGTVIDLLG